jgi:ubiquitin-protein ligase
MESHSSVEQINTYPINGAMKKRLRNEYIKLKQTHSHVSIDFVDDNVVFQVVSNTHNNYKIFIPDNYPFVPPTKVIINGTSHNKFFNIISIRLKNMLKHVTNSKIECLCCASYLCKTNWMPTIGMEALLTQFEEFKNIKKRIYTNILVNQIKEKYGIIDVDLLEWLL